MTQRAIDGDYTYFVTANVQDRRWFFVMSEQAAVLGRTIQSCCKLKNFDLLAYCILPNHVHLLVRKTAPTNERAQRVLEKTRCGSGERVLYQNNVGRPILRSSTPSPQSGLASPRVRYTLSQLMQSIKGTYSWETTDETIWHPRFNFRIVETEERFYNTVNYIIHNYTKMNLHERFGGSPFVFVDWMRIKEL